MQLINRTGETKIMNNGLEAVIIKYINAKRNIKATSIDKYPEFVNIFGIDMIL